MKKYEFNHSKNNTIHHQEDTNLNFEKHLHTNLEFIHVYDGELVVDCEDRIYTLRSGDSSLILPNELHSYTTTKFSKSYLCVFSQDFVNSFNGIFINSNHSIQFSNPVFSNLKVSDIYEFKQTDCFYLKKSFLYKVCSFAISAGYNRVNKKNDRLSSIILDYIHLNYSKKINILDLSKKFNYNHKYLSSCFSCNLGINIVDYLTLVRLYNAQKDLRNSTESITQIALNNGFGSIRNFNRCFKEKCNISPTEYRKNPILGQLDLNY
ncbi:MAG: AraC family transcriptional regulator [Firmicutes bacterium]|nr:AraC family transcriptional regulator [Bacillota bacterium]MCL1953291.1 AraC family transcriptional regulator [Bacillota bacterium]